MSETPKPNCSGKCSIESFVIAIEKVAEGYTESAETEQKEMTPEAKVVCARAAFLRSNLEAMPRENCSGNTVREAGDSKCAMDSTWNMLQEGIAVNGLSLQPNGEPLLGQEVFDGVAKNASKRATRQQAMIAMGSLEANKDLKNEFPAQVQEVESAMRGGAPARPGQPHPGGGQYL